MPLSLRALAALPENPSLSSQYPLQEAHNWLCLQFWGTQYSFSGSLKHHLFPFLHKVAYTQTDTFTNTDKTSLQKNYTNSICPYSSVSHWNNTHFLKLKFCLDAKRQTCITCEHVVYNIVSPGKCVFASIIERQRFQIAFSSGFVLEVWRKCLKSF